MTFFRQPSPLEFSYLALDQPNYSPLVNQFFVIGDGDIELEALKLASKQAALANPGILLRLKGVSGWRFWDSEGHFPEVKEINAKKWNSFSSQDAPCLGDPIDVRNESPCQIIKIFAANGTHILFRTHHAITDGRGTVHFMNDTFRILRGEPPLGSDAKWTEWDIAAREDYPPRELVEGNCLSPLNSTIEPKRTGYQWYRFDWTGSKNKFAAKLIQAIHLVTRENSGEGRVIFRIPSDLRRYLKEDDGFTVANCSGAIDLELMPDDSVNSIRSALIKAMRNKKDLSVFTPQQRYARWLPKSMFRSHPQSLVKLHKSQRYRMSGTISYMGEVDNAAFSCPGFSPFSQFGVPIPFETRPLFVAACSYGEITNIIMGCPKAIASQDELIKFCDQVSAKLDSLS